MKLQEILADIVKKVQNRPRLFENCQSQKKAYPLRYESEKTKLPQNTQPIKNIHEPERTGCTGIFISL
jgi:hypothetical protein